MVGSHRNDTITVTVTLIHNTFDPFKGHCEGQNGLHTHFAHNLTFVVVTVTELLGLNEP